MKKDASNGVKYTFLLFFSGSKVLTTRLYCVSLCVQLVTYYAKWKKPLECELWHILPAYFTSLMNSKNFKNDIFGFHTT